MATTRQEFIDLADEIFTEFADFLAPGIFSRVTGTDRETGQLTKMTQSVDGIQVGFNEKVFGSRLVKGGDYMQIYKMKDFTWLPSVETDLVERGGIESRIIDSKIDAAGATIYLHLRRL